MSTFTDDDLTHLEARGIPPLPAPATSGFAENDNARIWYANFGDGPPVVLVSHDAVLSHLLAALDPSLGTPGEIAIPTASWTRLEGDGDRWRAAAIGRAAGELAETR